MKKLFALLLFISASASAQQWALTNNDLTIQVVKNGVNTTQIGKWLADFAVSGDSVIITFQRNRDDSHFKFYMDKDSVTSPTVASASALRDTLELWTTGTVGGVAGVTSVSQGFGITASPNPIVATGSISVDSTQVATPYDLATLTKVDSIDRRIDSVFYYINGAEYFAFLDSVGSGSYSDEQAQDAVGAMINSSLQYVDGTPLLAINDRDFGDVDASSSGTVWTVDTNAITDVKVNDVAWSKVTGEPSTLAGYGISDTKANFDAACSDGNFLYVGDVTQYTDEMAQDATGAMAANSTFINLTYVDGTPSLTPSLSAAGSPSGTTFLRGDNTWAAPTAVLGDGDYGDVVVGGSGTTMTVESFTTANEAADATSFPVFVTSAASAASGPKTNTNLTFDASINRLGATTFIGTAFLSSAANTAASGVFRAANTGKIMWRNAGNTSQYGLTLNASNVFEFDAGATGVKSNQYVDAVSGFRVNGAASAGTFLVGDGNNYIASTSTIPTSAGATANKWLKSDATNYVLSTSTLAEGAVTAGKILVSDATNWVASTPTFPNASATSGKIIKSDGTNWVASTETYAAPSTSGNIMVSDGTNWTSSPTFKITSGQTTADRTSTSTLLADVTDLAAFSTAASTKYYFEFNLSVTTNATTVGILLSVNHSTAITSIRFNITYPVSASANNVQQNLTALQGGVQPTAGNGATIQEARVWGIMTTNTAGTFALQFASETGAAVVVKAGSTGTLQIVN